MVRPREPFGGKNLVLSKEGMLLQLSVISLSAEAGVPEGLAASASHPKGLKGSQGGYRVFLVVAATSTGTHPGSLCGFAGSFMCVVQMILMCFFPFPF